MLGGKGEVIERSRSEFVNSVVEVEHFNKEIRAKFVSKGKLETINKQRTRSEFVERKLSADFTFKPTTSTTPTTTTSPTSPTI